VLLLLLQLLMMMAGAEHVQTLRMLDAQTLRMSDTGM
jgi:hypothetical protein